MAEIERKWLLAALPPQLDAPPGATIRQGYVALTDDVEVRVRDIDGRRLLTIKGAGDLTRVEVELELSQREFDELWPLTQCRRLEKTRTRVDLGGLTAEVDVYAGALAPLHVVEIEFESEQQARAFEAPDWFGRDVTGDPAYKNRALAIAGQPPARR